MRLADALVDLAAVLSASRSVATKHVALRARQLDRYGKTSSIVAASLGRSQPQAGQSRSEESHVRQPADSAPARDREVAADHESATATAPSVASHAAQDAAQEPVDPLSGFPSMRVGELKPRSAPAGPSSGPGPDLGTSGFVPAPWATGVTAGAVHRTSVRKPPFDVPPHASIPIVPESSGSRSKAEDARGVVAPVGVDVSVFRTARGSKMLESPTEMVDNHLQESVEENIGKPGNNGSALERTTGEPSANLNPSLPAGDALVASEIAGPQPEPTLPADTTSTTPNSGTEEAILTEDVISNTAVGERTVDPAAELSSLPAYELHESKVPSSRLGRIWNYSGLAAGMFAGAMGESFSRALGGGSGKGSVMLSAANMERLVAKLSRMRGAALKMGQMMSFQDSKMLPAPIQEVLQRVQDRADYMPAWQRDRVLASNLGADWRQLFDEFEEKPIAAASIGQVHRATLRSNGDRVAVKIQFPGVADSINSDLDNLGILLTATSLLPKGLYLNKTIDNARTELAWECDYEREAECARRYRDLLADETDVFTVPKIYPEACGKQVLTMEFMDGVGVTRVKTFTQEQRDWIGTQILRLCLREITEFHFMQTDPNWTNFLYNAEQNRLELLDFGASREYPDRFISLYVHVLEAASRSDRAAVQTLSEQLGYLTGHESRAMLDAHVTSVVTLAEPFLEAAPELYDFRDQTITERVKAQIPVMIRERLAPPPEETYSLHRKLSGAFLLCARLGSRVPCRDLFRQALEKRRALETTDYVV